MRPLSPKLYAYYLLFGSLIHVWYGTFGYFYYPQPAEPLAARWPEAIIAIGLSLSILVFRISQRVAEFIFLFCICMFSWHFLYIVSETPYGNDYFQGFSLLLIACSLMLFNKKHLFFYFVVTLPMAFIVGLGIKGYFSTVTQLMNLAFIGVFIYVASILKIDLFEALSRAQQASESSKRKLETQYKMNLQAAHDLSSPVSAINGVAEKIKYEDPKLYKMLQSSVERIKDISRDLLAEHREKREQVESDFFDIENNISQIVADKRQEYKDIPHFFIMYRVTAPVINQVKIPKTEFYRVLSNIINNSMDAMQRQTEKRIKIVIDPRPEDVSLLITDNGDGISEDQVAHIFEENVSFKEDGNGLGLSFARQKVREWGGEIHLKSTSGKGTTFELIIPFSFS